MKIVSWEFESPPLHIDFRCKLLLTVFNAAIAQLVEHDLAKVGVASSSLVSRSKHGPVNSIGFARAEQRTFGSFFRFWRFIRGC